MKVSTLLLSTNVIGSRAKVISDILKRCINTEYRIGMTGTLPTAAVDLLSITSVLGSVLFTITSKELIDRGILTPLTVIGVELKYPLDFIKQNRGRAFPEEVKLVETYENRNEVALKKMFSIIPEKHNVLLLCNHIEHVNSTAEWLRQHYPQRTIKIIDGGVKADIREDIRKKIEIEDGTVIVATFGTCSTGINMPKLHEVILYSSGKSKIKILQSLGRGLRKHSTKNRVFLFDCIDNLSYSTKTNVIRNYLYQHWLERKKYYDEQKFPVQTTVLEV